MGLQIKAQIRTRSYGNEKHTKTWSAFT